jgi:hypothetical protein
LKTRFNVQHDVFLRQRVGPDIRGIRIIVGGVGVVGVVDVGEAPDGARHQNIVLGRLGCAEDHPEVRGPDSNPRDLRVVYTMIFTEATNGLRNEFAVLQSLFHRVLPRTRVVKVVGLPTHADAEDRGE